jgi:hypothetical protein
MDGRGIGERRCDMGGSFAASHGLMHGIAVPLLSISGKWDGMDGWMDGRMG